jgi:hypothetical protein
VKERELSKSPRVVRINDINDDTRSRASSHRSKASKAHRSKSHHDRPALERGYTDSFYANDSPRTSKHRFEADLAGDAQHAHQMELARRNSDQHVSRSRSEPFVDMDLAYGDIPPPLPEKRYDDGELKEKASKIEMLLDEANALQHTATAIIENLQKNPEALAAVSLTLAEISAIVGKMGPGVLLTLKGSFPAVAALLLSPQFMIAGGVAVGVTIVALGGYKIIKKIQAQKEVEAPVPMQAMPTPLPMHAPAPIEDSNNQLDELEPQELSRVEMWRRGIADVEANSAGTSVDGEFITPGASRTLVAAGVLDEDDLKSRRSTRSRKDGAAKSHRAKSEKSVRTSASKSVKTSTKTEKTSKTEKSSKTEKTADTKKSKSVKESSQKKAKEPSGLKMLFRAHATAA